MTDISKAIPRHGRGFRSISGAAAALVFCASLGVIASRVNAGQTLFAVRPGAVADAPAAIQYAQTAQAPNSSSEIDDERKRLRGELARIRRKQIDTPSQPAIQIPPLPVRRPIRVLEASVDAVNVKDETQAAGNAAIGKLVSQLLIFDFVGTEASESGVKAVEALLQQGAIAGVIIGKQNTVSRNQLRDLIKGLAPNKGKRAIVAIRETGGASDALTYENGFEPWPSQTEVIAKGDPNYAYSTYRTLASNLEFLGVTLNIGPKIGSEDADGYGSDPLRNAVFAKTFILGHREGHISPVPLIDQGDVSFRTLKSILVSQAAISVAATAHPAGWPKLFNSPLITGARLCLVDNKSGPAAETAPADISQGCDVFVIAHAGDQPSVLRQRIGASIANAVAKGELSMERLTIAAERAQALRS